VIAALTTVGLLAPSTAAADPAPSHIERIVPEGGRVLDVWVWSAAMASAIELRVLPPPDPHAPAPVVYLLNGAQGGENGSDWIDQTDVASYFAHTQVTVVVPMGGVASYFTDWRRDDPVLGRQRWTTFLTQELPPLIDAKFHGTGRNAIAGISMAGTSVFQLALAAPRLYRAIGSYSACVRTSDPAGQLMVNAVVDGRGHGNTLNMWGPPSDHTWVANDPYVNAERLRGLAIYVSNGTGVPGPLDTLYGPGINGDPVKLLGQLVSGGFLEVVTNVCAHQLRARLAALRIPATFRLRPNGTHSWGYWQQDFHESWHTTIAPALGVRAE
jgi:S-formylglutathione hydrolase FrmB